jgi:hypothetical protein
MGWFKRRTPVGNRCDSCNAVLDPTNGYYLPTKTVVLSERYWIHALTYLKAQMDAFGMSETQRLSVFRDYVVRMAGQSTAWSVCEKCSEFFFIDRQEARAYAASGKTPPGSGKADPEGCIQYAAQGFEQVFGFWPPVTDQPPIEDTCAFCRKKIYANDFRFYITEEVLARDRASRVIDDDPVRPPQPHDGGMAWSMCTPCAARKVARDDRARMPVIRSGSKDASRR